MKQSQLHVRGRLEELRCRRRGRKPAHWTRIDRLRTLRIGMQGLLRDLGITPIAAAAAA